MNSPNGARSAPGRVAAAAVNFAGQLCQLLSLFGRTVPTGKPTSRGSHAEHDRYVQGIADADVDYFNPDYVVSTFDADDEWTEMCLGAGR